MAGNGSRVCDGADKYIKSFYYKLNFGISKTFKLGENPALLQNRCYLQYYLGILASLNIPRSDNWLFSVLYLGVKI
ncbi:hypothetical protein SAMN05421876_1222 [Kaistella jeonii]|nr:hypothetical protein SAMN05421876_1222 [Kaistella jeonii]VEI96527.1 Uncharacterised protein [Kaistella jeonii]